MISDTNIAKINLCTSKAHSFPRGAARLVANLNIVITMATVFPIPKIKQSSARDQRLPSTGQGDDREKNWLYVIVFNVSVQDSGFK